MIDHFIPQIEEAQAQGAVVLLKWDGERTKQRCTVSITHKDTDYVWRKDCDDIYSGVSEALKDYYTQQA